MRLHPLFFRESAVTASVLALLSGLSLGAAMASTSNPASYPLETCIVSGEKLGEEGDVVVRQVDGREVRFCCKMCVKDFEKDPASYLSKLDQAIIAAQLPDYPLDVCVVSGEALGGEMGDPVDYIVGNRLIRLCCSSCKKDIAASPSTFLEKLDSAVVQAQLDAYPAPTCPISGEKLGGMGEPFTYVFAGRLVRFCCSGCIKSFDEDPQAAMARIDEGDDAPAGDEHDHSGHQH